MMDDPSFDPWTLLPACPESCWTPDNFGYETKILAQALQFSLSGYTDCSDVLAAGSPSLLVEPEPAPPASEVATKWSRKRAPSPQAGKISKRKSRSSKRWATTTYIAADPANFRWMVQQVTGLGGTTAAAEEAPEPEPVPRRKESRVALDGGCLPTLDTSAFWLERNGVGSTAGSSAAPSPVSQASFGSVLEGSGFDSNPPFLSIPTLDSWGLI